MKKTVGTLRMWLVALGFVLAFVGLSSSGDLSSVFSEQVSPTQDLSSSSSSGANEEVRGLESASSSANGDAPGLELPVAKTKLSQTIKHRTAYTVSYNHDTRQPNWVAWALTRAHASGNLKRGDFEDDLDMPSPKGTKADYYNSGFDRGHLCPAGDNKWSQKAMDECFLMTNMCPQTHALNAGIWNSSSAALGRRSMARYTSFVVQSILTNSIASWARTRWWCLMPSSRSSSVRAGIRKPSVSSVATSRKKACRRKTSSIRWMRWSASRVTTSSQNCRIM